MAEGLTASEQLVNNLCERAFLRLWTHPNPIGKKGKELCDCLIVCEPHVIVVSVKECEYKDTGDRTGWDRWVKKAIEKSIDQIYGAERWLEGKTEFTRADGREVVLPPQADRVYHRIAVALGGDRQSVRTFRDEQERGWVHICDEHSLESLFRTLDTITDFVGFLQWVEQLVQSGPVVMNGGGLEDLLGIYLEYPQLADDAHDALIVHNDWWSGVSASEEFLEHHRAMHQLSPMWDRLIELLTSDLLTDGFFDAMSGDVTDDQRVLLAMARESREARECIMQALHNYWTEAYERVASRMVQSPQGHVYVFMVRPSSQRQDRVAELAGRCMVIRGRIDSVETVIGIANDRPGSGQGSSFDLLYLSIPNADWTDEDERQVLYLQQECELYSHL